MQYTSQATELSTPLFDEKVVEPTNDENRSEEDLVEPRTCVGELSMGMILCSLLASQFGLAFLMHNGDLADVSLNVVNFGIFLFGITAWLYRNTCEDANVRMIALLLLPEILMDVILLLLFFDLVSTGFLVMLSGMLFLSVFVVVVSCIIMYRKPNLEKEENKELPGEPKILIACQVV